MLAAMFLSDFLLDQCLGAVLRRHPSLTEALDALGGARVGIDPTDLPVAFLLDCSSQPPRLRLRRSVDTGEADAIIRGTLLTLLDLCDGRLDGDAAFFARQLSFEGDTAAVVALRNALDGADIDLRRDLRQRAEALPAPLRRLAGLGIGTASRLCDMKRQHDRKEAL